MKTYLEVVEETVEYYKNNPFGYDKDNAICAYWTKEGRMCAVGRCLNNPELLEGQSLNAETVIVEKMGGGLKKEYSHLLNTHFWSELQVYHDYAVFKDTDTEKKLTELEEIAKKLDN